MKNKTACACAGFLMGTLLAWLAGQNAFSMCSRLAFLFLASSFMAAHVKSEKAWLWAQMGMMAGWSFYLAPVLSLSSLLIEAGLLSVSGLICKSAVQDSDKGAFWRSACLLAFVLFALCQSKALLPGTLITAGLGIALMTFFKQPA